MLKTPPVWNQLDANDRKVIMATCFGGSLDGAIRSLRLPITQVSKRITTLEQVINCEEVVRFRQSLQSILLK